MQLSVSSVACYFLVIFVLSIDGYYGADGVKSVKNDGGNTTRLLSRRKRFLVFPDGSSFQLVFCTQNHGYLRVGDIVWFGQTAALAWELPTDPQLFYMLKDYKQDFAQKRQDFKKHIYYLNEDGKVISKVPYKRKIIVNPAFAKRSLNSLTSESDQNLKQLNIKRLHDKHINLNYVQNLDKESIAFHRKGRKSFYAGLEKFLEALGWQGKECVLRYLCEAGKRRKAQGTFLEEIFTATFTFPKSNTKHKLDDFEEYDAAHQHKEDCSVKYPTCARNYE